MKRRDFLSLGLRSSALGLLGARLLPSFLQRAVAEGRPSRRVLVLVFQRGAADGLSMVPPVGDPGYAAARPTLALGRPGSEGGALPLTDLFGLHPALAGLKPAWDAGVLAAVHAAGLPGATRSHFDAQDFCETGTPGRKGTPDGWVNRCLQQAPVAAAGVLRAVALQPTLPRSLVGGAPAVSLGSLDEFKLRGGAGGLGFDALYADAVDAALRTTGEETFEALREAAAIQGRGGPPEHGADYGRTPFGKRMRDIARLIRAEVGLQVAVTEVGGWDTHVGQGGAVGQLANRLRDFGDALGAFVQDLGPRMGDVLVLTMTEFGRTVHENGNRGTDHGSASVMLALGGGVRGKRVLGSWKDLTPANLYEGRDLAILTDVRAVLAEAVTAQLNPRNLEAVFPGYAGPTRAGLLG